MTVLTLPGYTGSGPRHWQTLWEAADRTIIRVEQADWDRPDAEAWSANIEAAVRRLGPSTILVAHSCGCLAVAQWSARFRTPIAGAFMVAPPDVESSNVVDVVKSFGLPPLARLPFESVVVASEDDPYCGLEQAGALARGWGAPLMSVGRAGHINTASGHGPWPEGRQMLTAFCSRLSQRDGA